LGYPFAGQAPQDLRLQRVCVLELIDQNPRVPARQGLPDGLACRQQISGVVKQIVEVQQRRVALVLGVQLLERGELGDEALECHLAQGSTEFAVCGVACPIMRLAGGAELLTKGRALPACLGGILPFALLAPLPETSAILFADGWLLMGQELGDSLACHGAGRQFSGNIRDPGEIGDHLGGFPLDDQAAIVPCGEGVDRGSQPRENALVHDRRRRRGRPMIFEKFRRFGDQLHGRVWRRVHQFGEKVLAAASARHRWNSSQPF